MTDATPLASEQITQPDWFDDILFLRSEIDALFARTKGHSLRAKEWNDRGHAILDRIAALSATPAPSDQDASPSEVRSMETAPKDGTMLRLLVHYTDGGGPLDDALKAWTIGFNDLDGTGVDEWKFAGWCWTHDHFSQGSGTPVGWLPWSNPSTGGDEQ